MEQILYRPIRDYFDMDATGHPTIAGNISVPSSLISLINFSLRLRLV